MSILVYRSSGLRARNSYNGNVAGKIKNLPNLKIPLSKKKLPSARTFGRIFGDIIPGFVFGIVVTTLQMWDHVGSSWDDETETWDATL